MSSLPADIIIWALLFVGTVFAGLGLMGLLIFPDTRSRMFTAFRATAISLGAVAFAVVTYGYTLFTTTGSNEYAALIIRTLFFVIVLAAGTSVMYRIIRERIQKE
jgi:multisubunit Na+/H+ antiporter MnhG subunit